MENKNNVIYGGCNPTKVLPSSYPNQISIIEGIIRVSTFCDDFSDCYSKEKLANFIIGYLDPIIKCNILKDENGEEKHTVFNAFHSDMIATHDRDMSFWKVFGEEDGICVMFRLQFNMEIGCFLNIPIDFLERFVKIEKNSHVHLYSSKDGVVTLDEMKNYNRIMRRDVTNYPLSPNQRKEVEEYMNNHNVSENEARYMLGYVPLDIGQVTVMEALEMVKEENPNVELTNESLNFYLDEVMKKSIPKPNPKLAMEILRANLIK